MTSIWKDRYHSTTIAGVKGVDSFVRLRREDGTIDHGYLVVALGSPHAGQFPCDASRHSTCRLRRKAGVAPLDEASSFALARDIVAKVATRVPRGAWQQYSMSSNDYG